MPKTLNPRFQPAIEQMRSWHGDQVRKYSFEPYWTHPVAVASMVSEHLDQEEAILAALFHDVVEDTPYGFHEIFGFVTVHFPNADPLLVTDTVMDLTNRYEKSDCPGLNRAQRHDLETLRLARISPLAQSVKYGDIAHNCQSIHAHDPGYALRYFAEKRDILRVMRDGHPGLRANAWSIIGDT